MAKWMWMTAVVGLGLAMGGCQAKELKQCQADSQEIAEERDEALDQANKLQETLGELLMGISKEAEECKNQLAAMTDELEKERQTAQEKARADQETLQKTLKMLMEAEVKIKDQKKALAEKDAQLADRDKQLAEKDAQLAAKDKEITELKTKAAPAAGQ